MVFTHTKKLFHYRFLEPVLAIIALWAAFQIPIQDLQAQSATRYEFESVQMGSEFRIVFYSTDDSLARRASDSAFEKISALNQKMSDYIDDSELNRLSAASGSGEWIRISEPLFNVITRSLEISPETDGALDITVGPYVRLWRQMRQMPKPELPSDTVLQNLRPSVGFRHIKVDSTSRSVKLLKPGMRLDLGAVAKGYAADEALKVLRSYGITSALIDAGGDIVLGDAPPGKEGWQIVALTHASRGASKTQTLTLSNRAIATSGDLFQFVEIGGTRYSHIINPKTGLGLTDRSMVTVIAPDGITADSYASAISVMGAKQGLKLLNNKLDISGFIEYRTDGVIKRVVSSGFDELVSE